MTGDNLDKYLRAADTRMKLSNGHQYVTILKTRCSYCGRSPTQKGRCVHWFNVFIDHFRTVLLENGEIQE